MKTLFKYPLVFNDLGVAEIEAPLGPVRLVGVQVDVCYAWIEVITGEADVKRRFHVYGTGHEVDDSPTLRHVGSFQAAPFVWHVYEDEAAWRR